MLEDTIPEKRSVSQFLVFVVACDAVNSPELECEMLLEKRIGNCKFLERNFNIKFKNCCILWTLYSINQILKLPKNLLVIKYVVKTCI